MSHFYGTEYEICAGFVSGGSTENCKLGRQVGFPTGRDSATFRDKGTEVPSLSRDKGTMGQSQNLAMGWDRPQQPIKFQNGTRDRTITILL